MQAAIVTRNRTDTISIVPQARGNAAPTQLKTLCSNCHLKDLCLPCGLGNPDVERLDALMFARRRVKEGQVLYREGDRFQFIYAVRSGTFKSALTLKDGREQ